MERAVTDVRRVLAQIADQVTDCLFKQTARPEVCLRIANEALVAIREQAQDALGEIMEEQKVGRQGVYGKMCRDPDLCIPKGYCPRDPTCAD